jgi:hypothetical protein
MCGVLAAYIAFSWNERFKNNALNLNRSVYGRYGVLSYRQIVKVKGSVLIVLSGRSLVLTRTGKRVRPMPARLQN